MRQDVLELDLSFEQQFTKHEITLEEVESIRLLLSGGSVIDWQRLAFNSREEVNQFLRLHLLDPELSEDRERVRYVYNEAVSYLEEHLKLELPPSMRNPSDVRDVFLAASTHGRFSRVQILSCVVLKLMHVINHLEASDLRFNTAISEAQIFDIAQSHIHSKARKMQHLGYPVISFYGSRKSRSSIITKLLAKKESIAATIFDKLRFRIIVSNQRDLVPVLAHMTRSFFPFNYVIPGQSHNNLLEPQNVQGFLPKDADIQTGPDQPIIQVNSKNELSGESYRMINFIVDYPVRVPDHYLGPRSYELGKVVFVLVEFQILDEQTAHANEQGENAHHLYKERQRSVVGRRLKRGRNRG
jgi:uncharacterized protein (TIGR04552 family)